MQKFTSIIALFILLLSSGINAQDLEFQLNPSDAVLHLFDTVTFTADIPIDLPPDSIFFKADQGQAIMMQMGRSTFFAKRVGSSVITCNVYFGNQKYTSTTTVQVIKEGDPEPEKLHFLQRQIRFPVNTVTGFKLIPYNANVRLEASDPGIVTIDANARVLKGLNPGNTVIYAYWQGQVDSCLVSVVSNDPVGSDMLSIKPNPIHLEVGDQLPVEITSKSLIMLPIQTKVENPAIADFDEEGMLTGKMVGRTWLHAVQGEYLDSALVVVYPQDTVPEIPIIKVEMKKEQITALKRLFPRMNADMQMDIHSNGVIRMDASLMVYATSSGRAVINFYSADNRLLFKGVILVDAPQRPVPEPVENIWMERNNLLNIKFREPLDSINESLLTELVSVAVLTPDILLDKNGDLIDIIDAQLLDNNTLLVLELSRELDQGETLKVTINDLWSGSDENGGEARDYFLNETPIGVQDNKRAKLNIYPNPATTVLTVSSPVPIQQIQTYSLQGKLLESTNTNGVNNFAYHIEHFSAGTYILKITDVSGNVHKTSLIKQ